MSPASFVIRRSRSVPRRLGLSSLLLFAGASLLAQGGVRPVDPGAGGGGIVIGPGGGVITPLPGGGGGGGGVFPPIVIGGGGVVFTGPRIVTAAGILVGQVAQASVVVPVTGGATTPAPSAYQWTLSGGRLTSDPTRQLVTFIADAAGTVSLNVVVTTGSTSLATSADVTVLSPAVAGVISSAATVTTNMTAASLTASVPPRAAATARSAGASRATPPPSPAARAPAVSPSAPASPACSR